MRTIESSNQESGSSIVELAVSLPLFVLLMLGTAEIANIGWTSIQLNNAAHAGAQFGSISRTNAGDTTDMESAAQSEAPQLAVTFPSAPVTLCTCITPSTGKETPNPPGSCTGMETTCLSPDVIVAYIQVTTQAVVHPIIHYPGLPASYTLHGHATMGIVQ